MQVRLIACLSAVLILCYASSLVYGQQLTQPERIPIGALYDLTIVNITTGQSTAAASSTIAMASALKLGFDDINAAQQIVPGSQFDLAVYDSQSTISGSLAALLHATETNNSYSVLGGPNTSNQCTITAVASASYNILLVSATASASGLNNTALYRLFSRMVAGDNFQTNAMVQFIQFYYNQTLEPNWLSVAVICTADDYGVSGSKDFINKAPGYNITLSTFQNFLLGATDVSVEVGELKNSASRVFIAFMAVAGFQTVIQQAKEEKLIHEEYIWICSDGCATDAIFEGLNSKDEQDFRDNVSGMFGTVPRGGSGTAYDEFLQRWKTLDPVKYPGTGGNPTIFALLAYDSAYLMAYLYRIHFDLGNYAPTGTDLFSVVSLVTFEGLTGNVSMETNGDRRGNYYVVNYNNNRNVQEFNPVFTWDVADGLVQIDNPVWYDGTTNIPDLGVLSSFQYWSCHKKEALTDKTGKTIRRVKPDGDDPNNIDIDYECDQYIDCDNMSDEAYQCTPSIVIAFIVVGIITGLLVLGNCLFIPAIILFSWILPRVRLILAGRFFLLFLTISCILGSISTYAWYGKPETVACNFQLWLFGIATSIMVGSIFAKNMTRFRSLGIPIKVVRKLKVPPELEFLVYFVIVFVIPIIIIVIWTIISTPKADLENHSDADHWVCTTGGPTGDPGGIVFFFILVGYYGFLLLLSFILLFLNRKTPYRFMDSRLMFISMFNLGFLAAVIIPVFFVLRWISPFAAWLVRTLGMLYGFNSTLWIHIVPKSIGLVICDKFKDNTSGPTTSAVKHRAGHDDDPSLSASLTQSTTIG